MGRHTSVLIGTMVAGLALSGLCMAQQPAAEPTDEALVAPAKEQHTLLDLLQRGGPVMYPLYLCSILTVAFTLERVISLRRRKMIPPEVAQMIQSLSDDSRDPALRRRLVEEIQASDSPIGRIVKAASRKANRPVAEMEKAVEDAGAKEVTRIQRYNKVFSAVASVAPLLGLLGTVTGIMRTFMTVAASAEALGRTQVLAGGIYEALVATAVGITIAVPSMVLYFFFQDRVEKLVADIDEAATTVLDGMANPA